MPAIFVSALLIALAYPLIGSAMAIWVLAASQLALLIGEIRKRQVSGVGAFVFMSFLFFGVRPIYMIAESDYRLMMELFRVRTSMESVGDAMWWASLALLCFVLGAFAAPRIGRRWLQRRFRRSAAKSMQYAVSQGVCYGMLFFQLLTLPIMYSLSKGGQGLYMSGLGAYAYDVPVPLQSVHIIAVVVFLERYLRTKNTTNLVMLVLSGFLFLDFTWLMREVSMFRGFYVAGVMIAGIAVLQRIKGRVGYAWLIIPIVAVQPFFQYLGEVRTVKNEEVSQKGIVDSALRDRSLAAAYWQFYSSRGDMNIFDTFIAARQAQPKFYPYAWSWLYVPLHFIPRALWTGKPRKGITIDISFMRGFPYCPGIVGFFLMDGGSLWMLGSMVVLGFLIAMLDGWVVTLPRGYLQYCLIGIVTVNAMFLTRFFLFQYFYQMLYSMVPCLLMAWWFSRSTKLARASARNAAVVAHRERYGAVEGNGAPHVPANKLQFAERPTIEKKVAAE